MGRRFGLPELTGVKTCLGSRRALVAAVSRQFDWLTYTSRHGLLKGMKRKGGLGFLPEWLVGGQETPEEQFFRKLDLREKVVFDVGAFHGLTALFFSRTARVVIAFEPNPANCAQAAQNVRVNALANVFLLNVAIGEEGGELQFAYDEKATWAGSADPQIAARTAGVACCPRSITVPVVTLDGLVESGLPRPDFIKIDVEGMETKVLRGMDQTLRAFHPDLYVEIHGITPSDKEANAREVIGFLERHGYASFSHVESGVAVTLAEAAKAKEGHLFCARQPSGGAASTSA